MNISESLQSCPICNAFKCRNVIVNSLSVEKCSQCGHLFLKSPSPQQGLQHHNSSEEYNKYRIRNNRLVKALMNRKFLGNDISLLDVGSGSGHLIKTISNIIPSIKISCIEPDKESAEHLSTSGMRVLPNLESALVSSYDSILLIEVIEHIEYPVQFLTVCRSLLSDTGKIFLTTPCGETRSGSRNTNAYHTKEHIHFFTEKSLTHCCEMANLHFEYEEISELYPIDNPLIAKIFCFMRRSRNIIRGRAHLVGFASKIV